MTLKELRAKAKAAGMKNADKATKKEIDEFFFVESKKEVTPSVEEATTQEELTQEEPVQATSKKATYDVAIVRRPDGHEVRRYTRTLNGKNFAKLAEEFVLKKKAERYTVEMAFENH